MEIKNNTPLNNNRSKKKLKNKGRNEKTSWTNKSENTAYQN